MTPEEAREWLCGLEEADENDLQDFVGWKEVADALETIANLRTEYAVQVPVATAVPGEPVWRFFVRRGTNGGAILTAVPGLAKWETSQRDAKKRAELHELTGYRIVRRLVSESEVVE